MIIFGQQIKPYSSDEITSYLQLPDSASSLKFRNESLIDDIKKRGLNFVLTRDVLNKLVESGANNELIELIHKIQYLSLREKDISNEKITYPPNVNAQLTLARQSLRKGMEIADSGNKNFAVTYDQAISSFTNAINLAPNSVGIYYERARALEYYSHFGGHDDVDKMISDYTKAIALDPECAIAYYDRGLANGKKARYGNDETKYHENAIKDYNEFLRLRPQFVDFLDEDYVAIFERYGNELANECNRRGEACKNAITYLSKAIQLSFYPFDRDSSIETIYDRRADVYKFIKDYEKAIEDLSKVIQIIAENTNTGRKGYLGNTYLKRGDLFHDKGEYNFAISDYTKAIEIIRSDKVSISTSSLKDGYQKRGLAYYDKKEFDKAIADFSKVIELFPQNDWNYYLLGRSYSHLKNFKNEIENYSKAINLLPTNYKITPGFFEKSTEASRVHYERIYLDARADAYENIGRKDLAEADRAKAKQLPQK